MPSMWRTIEKLNPEHFSLEILIPLRSDCVPAITVIAELIQPCFVKDWLKSPSFLISSFLTNLFLAQKELHAEHNKKKHFANSLNTSEVLYMQPTHYIIMWNHYEYYSRNIYYTGKRRLILIIMLENSILSCLMTARISLRTFLIGKVNIFFMTKLESPYLPEKSGSSFLGKLYNTGWNIFRIQTW